MAHNANRFRQIRRQMRHAKAVDFAHDFAPLKRWHGYDGLRRRRHEHERERVPCRSLSLTIRRAMSFAPIESCFPILHRVHRERAIEHEHSMRSRPSARWAKRRTFEVRLCDGQYDDCDQQRANGQQQSLLKSQSSRTHALAAASEKRHRGPGHFAMLRPTPKMDRNRHGHRR